MIYVSLGTWFQGRLPNGWHPMSKDDCESIRWMGRREPGDAGMSETPLGVKGALGAQHCWCLKHKRRDDTGVVRGSDPKGSL